MIDPKLIFAAIEKLKEKELKQLSTSDKMLLRANGFSKEDVHWTGEDERVLSNIIPGREKLLNALTSRRHKKKRRRNK
jgi:hypothetical protein